MTKRTLLPLLLVLAGCSRSDHELRPEPSASAPPVASVAPPVASAAPPVASAAPSASAPTAPAPSGPLVLARGVRMVHAAKEGDAARVVREARQREQSDGRDLVVYVGAKWCEPCQRFHKAAAAGALDADFPSLSVLEFDLDDDRDRLVAAGYSSEFIPLFVVPEADGRASKKRFEGSVKGDGAVANIAPRLRAILAR